VITGLGASGLPSFALAVRPRSPRLATRHHASPDPSREITMDIRKVKKLIELLEESGISELEIKEGEESVRISRRLH
jgi:hypothetical protein